MTTRFLRQIAIVATAGALALSGIAVPATAGPKPDRGRGYEQSTKAKEKSAAKRQNKGNAKAAAAKARKEARFQANGTLLGVMGDTIIVAVKGGSAKSLRGQIAAFDVSDARVNRDDAPATVADLVSGDHVAVKGMKIDGVLVAMRVNAESPEPVTEDPTETTETVTEDPTEEVTEGTTETVTEEPTETVTETVTEEPTETVEPIVP